MCQTTSHSRNFFLVLLWSQGRAFPCFHRQDYWRASFRPGFPASNCSSCVTIPLCIRTCCRDSLETRLYTCRTHSFTPACWATISPTSKRCGPGLSVVFLLMLIGENFVYFITLKKIYCMEFAGACSYVSCVIISWIAPARQQWSTFC